MRGGGLPIHRFVATGGLPHHNPLIVQIYADVLGEPISVHPCQYGPALGAAILGTLAAGSEVSGFSSSADAIESMAGTRPGDPKRQRARLQTESANIAKRTTHAYNEYRQLADIFAKRVSV